MYKICLVVWRATLELLVGQFSPMGFMFDSLHLGLSDNLGVVVVQSACFSMHRKRPIDTQHAELQNYSTI